MDFVPCPLYGSIELHLYTDGRFGNLDPIQWPQVYSDKYPWTSVLDRQPEVSSHAQAIIWRDVLPTDFVVRGSVGSSLGTLDSRFLQDLSAAVATMIQRIDDEMKIRGTNARLQAWKLTMSDAVARLPLPSTYNDMIRQVVCVQRFWLYTQAYLRWYVELSSGTSLSYAQSVDTSLMGAITANPAVVQKLHRCGIPVWFLHRPEQILESDRLIKAVDLTLPSTIRKTGGTLVFSGEAGTPHMNAIFRYAHVYQDIPLVAPVEQQTLQAEPPRALQASSSVQRVPHQKNRSAPCESFSLSLLQ